MKQYWPYWRDEKFEELKWKVLKGNSYSTFQCWLYLMNWQTEYSEHSAKGSVNAEFYQENWNCYLMLEFVSVHKSWNAISHLKRERSYMTLSSEQVQQSASTLGNICWRDYSGAGDAIKKQLLSRDEDSLALDGWTSTNKLAIMSVITYYMHWPSAWREVQIAFNEVDTLFLLYFES